MLKWNLMFIQLGLIFSKRIFRKFWMRTTNILLSIVEVVTAITSRDDCNHIRNVEIKDLKNQIN